jgi:hypothetical protein
MRLEGQVAGMEIKINVYKLFVRKPEGRKQLGKPRPRWIDNIKMDLVERGWCGVDWNGLAQGRGNWRCGNKPSNSTERWETIK